MADDNKPSRDINQNVLESDPTGNTPQSVPAESVTKGNRANDCGKQRRRIPTMKQTRFAAEFVSTNGNGTEAARRAGYKGGPGQLAVQAHDNLVNPKVQNLIASMLDPLVTHAVARLGEGLDATTQKIFLGRGGNVIYAQPVVDYKTRARTAQMVLDLRGKCVSAPADGRDQDAHQVLGRCANGEQLESADRVLLHEVAAIDHELAELDCPTDHDDGHER